MSYIINIILVAALAYCMYQIGRADRHATTEASDNADSSKKENGIKAWLKHVCKDVRQAASQAEGRRTEVRDMLSLSAPARPAEGSAPAAQAGQAASPPADGPAPQAPDHPAEGTAPVLEAPADVMAQRRLRYSEACQAITFELQEEYPLFQGWEWVNHNVGRLLTKGSSYAAIRVRLMDGVVDERTVLFEKGQFKQLMPLPETEEVAEFERQREKQLLEEDEERRTRERVASEETEEIIPDEGPSPAPFQEAAPLPSPTPAPEVPASPSPEPEEQDAPSQDDVPAVAPSRPEGVLWSSLPEAPMDDADDEYDTVEEEPYDEEYVG